MDVSTAAQFLLDQIPISTQRVVPPALKRAYENAEALIASSPMLQIPTARDDRGRVTSWAVDFAIKGLIESGEWKNADYRWQPYASPTGCYLEVRLRHSTLSINQVRFWQEQPRDVVFRHNARLGNTQLKLWEPNAEEEVISGVPSFLLVHGYKELLFAHIGIPNQFHEHGYIYQTPNLMQMLYEVPAPNIPPPEKSQNIDEILSLKEQIEKWKRDNGD